MKAVTPIKRRKLYEDIVEQMERAIVEGEYAPGDALPPERELVAAFGVGRTSVREALFALQRRGLVTISSGERARVSSPTPQTLVEELSGVARHLLQQPSGMRHFQQARLVFEVALARLAAECATAEDVAELARLLEANRAAAGRRDLFEETDIAFHAGLARIPRNPIFAALLVGVAQWLREQRTTSLGARGSARAACKAHARIYDAVAARDPAAAEAAMRDHLTEVAAYYWKARTA